MYDELVKRLREAAEYVPCIMEREDAIKAADAIEELQEDKAALNGTVSNLIQQIAELSKPHWIPVTERLPEDGQDILAVHIYYGEVRIVPANYDRGVWYDCVFNRVADHITHWMPLPEPPKGD